MRSLCFTQQETFMHTIEWAAFRLQPGATVDALRLASQQMQAQFLSAQPGFVSRQLLALGEQRYADLVHWTSPQAAAQAMERATQHPACAAYFGLMAVDQSPLMGEVLDQHALAGAGGDKGDKQPGGLEFSRFRPLPGVSDAELAAAAARTAAGLYQGKPGFQDHLVVRNDRGEYADVVLADSAARARALCERWGTGPFHPACQDYLGLIDPSSMQIDFWQRVA
jgi:heme-degrading monooxygenase HmoA